MAEVAEAVVVAAADEHVVDCFAVSPPCEQVHLPDGLALAATARASSMAVAWLVTHRSKAARRTCTNGRGRP